mgnify:CR=1 FL=1
MLSLPKVLMATNCQMRGAFSNLNLQNTEVVYRTMECSIQGVTDVFKYFCETQNKGLNPSNSMHRDIAFRAVQYDVTNWNECANLREDFDYIIRLCSNLPFDFKNMFYVISLDFITYPHLEIPELWDIEPSGILDGYGPFGHDRESCLNLNISASELCKAGLSIKDFKNKIFAALSKNTSFKVEPDNIVEEKLIHINPLFKKLESSMRIAWERYEEYLETPKASWVYQFRKNILERMNKKVLQFTPDMDQAKTAKWLKLWGFVAEYAGHVITSIPTQLLDLMDKENMDKIKFVRTGIQSGLKSGAVNSALIDTAVEEDRTLLERLSINDEAKENTRVSRRFHG